VARHLDPAPFARQHAVLIDDEGAALDAADLSPVHVLHLHHAEQLAHRLVLVRQQVERELHLGLEAFVRLQRIARNPVDAAVGFGKPRVVVAEVRALRGAAGGVVLGVEVEHHVASAGARELERRVTGRGKAEVQNRLAEHFQRF